MADPYDLEQANRDRIHRAREANRELRDAAALKALQEEAFIAGWNARGADSPPDVEAAVDMLLAFQNWLDEHDAG
jgi:hypothetical protein